MAVVDPGTKAPQVIITQSCPSIPLAIAHWSATPHLQQSRPAKLFVHPKTPSSRASFLTETRLVLDRPGRAPASEKINHGNGCLVESLVVIIATDVVVFEYHWPVSDEIKA